MIHDQHLISQRFNLRADRYHGLSSIQAQMAADLVARLPADADCRNILEIGCGTGHLTQLLLERFPEADLIATDVAENMLRQTADRLEQYPNLQVAQAEAESLSQHPHEPPPDLVAGNAILQWLVDPIRTVQRFIAALPPNGMVAFATFGPETFSELQTLLRDRGVSHPLGSQPSPETWRQHLLNSAAVDVDTVTQYVADAATFLRDVSHSGAALPHAHLAHGELRALIRDYNSLATPNGIPVTWQRIFILANRHR